MTAGGKDEIELSPLPESLKFSSKSVQGLSIPGEGIIYVACYYPSSIHAFIYRITRKSDKSKFAL